MNMQMIVRRKAGLIATDLDGDKVMMDAESGNYFSLNAVGGRIWESLENPTSVEAVIEMVRAGFDMSEANDIESELKAFLTNLLENGLIREEVDE